MPDPTYKRYDATADAEKALLVDAAGAALVTTRGLKVITNSDLVVSTPTLSVAGSYATGDYIGPTTTPAKFANAVLATGGRAILNSLVIADKVTTAAVALELWLFSATFVAPTDNAAWAITDAEALTCLGWLSISSADWAASSNNKIYTRSGIGLVVESATTDVFYALVARGTTPTWASGDLQLAAGFLQD